MGTSYRSAIFYSNQQQKDIAVQSIKDLESKGQFKDPIVTEVVPVSQFYKAEEDHQKYLFKHGKGNCKI